MDSRGKIVKEWFGRTVIKSCAKLAYEHAQGMLDEPNRKWEEQELPPIQVRRANLGRKENPFYFQPFSTRFSGSVEVIRPKFPGKHSAEDCRPATTKAGRQWSPEVGPAKNLLHI